MMNLRQTSSTVLTVRGIGGHPAGDLSSLRTSLVEDQGFRRVVPLEYEPIGISGSASRSRQYETADRLLDGAIRQAEINWGPCHLVCHSFGALLAARMMELAGDYPFDHVFMFAPALDAEWSFPRRGARKIYVIHNPKDMAIFAAGFSFRHPWGKMGRVGWRAPEFHRSPPVTNVLDETDIDFLHHLHYFTPRESIKWGEFIARELSKELV